MPRARPRRRPSFRIALSLLGTERLDIVPVGATTTVSLASPWPHPSFTGQILPDAGTRLSAEGFAATWRTSHFATNLAQLHQRCAQSKQCDAFNQHTLGVSFIQPVDLYQTVERSVKYGFLFILLTFAAFFLFEVLRQLAIHPVQYALVGAALAIFFLLLISLSEHIGFAARLRDRHLRLRRADRLLRRPRAEEHAPRRSASRSRSPRCTACSTCCCAPRTMRC